MRPLRSLFAAGSISLILLVSAPTLAQQQDVSISVGTLCNAVDSKVLETDPTHDTILYRYQTMMYESAGLLESDPDATVFEKVRVWYNANATQFTCNLTNFNPRNGNVLKLAVARQFDEFIWDALDRWQVDLNQVDPTDNKTVLDYIRDRRATAGPTFARTLDRYYTRFRAAGARHADEL